MPGDFQWLYSQVQATIAQHPKAPPIQTILKLLNLFETYLQNHLKIVGAILVQYTLYYTVICNENRLEEDFSYRELVDTGWIALPCLLYLYVSNQCSRAIN